jgi:O-antigen ligase
MTMLGARTTRSGSVGPSVAFSPPETSDQKLWRAFGRVLGTVVVLYLFFDRGFAHFHIPHTPVYVGEAVIAFGIVCAAISTQWVRRALSGDSLIAVTIAWMLWGALRTIPNMPSFGIQNAIHDAALWYYTLFALLLITAATAVPDLTQWWLRWFSRLLPALSVWLLTTLLLNKTGVKGPSLRFDNVPFLSHKPGNVCVAALLCLAFLWLVPVLNYRRLTRIALSVLNLITIVFGATQTRGGGLAAAIAILVGLVIIGRRQRPAATLGLAAALVLGFGLASITGAALHTRERTISVSQLVQNIESFGLGQSSSSNPQLQGTENFRFSLWSKIYDEQKSSSHLVDGFGFGPNLANIGGVSASKSQTQTLSLRSAHNSPLDVFARTGIVGGTLWLFMFLGWFRRMWRAHRRYRVDGNEADRGLIDFCMLGTIAIIINSIFDPTLEGAQVAAILFSLFGIGIICARRPVLGPDQETDNEAAEPEPAGLKTRASFGHLHSDPAGT